MKSMVAAISRHTASRSYLERIGVIPEVFGQKLAIMVGQALGDFASEANASSFAPISEERVHSLSIILDAARALNDAGASTNKIELSEDALSQLKEASNTLASSDAAVVWKLRSFLVKQSADRYTTKSICAVLEQGSSAVEEELINDFVEAYLQEKSQPLQYQLLSELMNHERLMNGPIGPLVAARRLLELYQGTLIIVP